MAIVISNYLLLNNQAELSQRTLNTFLDRLTLFLQVSIDRKTYPKIKWLNYVDGTARAAFDQDKNEVQFNRGKYRIRSKKFSFNKKNIEEEIEQTLAQYTYCIPVSDIYHELIHFVQYEHIDYLHTPFLEATNELFVYILTGSSQVDYRKEIIAYLYVLTHILKLKNIAIYKSLRNAIVEEDFVSKYLLSDKNFLRMLSKKFDNDINKFLFNFSKLKTTAHFQINCWKELDNLHNLIFYKW